MREKLSIERFLEFKKEFTDIIEESRKYAEEHKDDEGFDEDAYLNEVVNKYIEVQNRLFQYDLSEIPFEAWKDIEIVGDKDRIADMSGTHANLDFDLLGNEAFIDCRGCNVRNIKASYRLLDEELFDPSVVERDPGSFIPRLSNPEVRDKILMGNLTMEDLFRLTKDEILLLKGKRIDVAFDYDSRRLIEDLGIDRAIDFYGYSRDDYEYVKALCNGRYGYPYFYDTEDKNRFLEKIRNCPISEIRKVVSAEYRSIVFNDRYGDFSPESFFKEFVEENKDLFLLVDGVSEELRQRYYHRELTIDDVLNNLPLFENIPFYKFMNHDNYVLDIISTYLGDKNLSEFVKTYPEIIGYIIKGNLSYKFVDYLRDNHFNINEIEDKVSEFRNIIDGFFQKNNGFYNREQFLLYKPEYYPLEESLQRVIDLFGIENIQRLERETRFFSGDEISFYRRFELLSAVSGYLRNFSPEDLKRENIDFKDGSLNYEEFKNEFAKLIDIMRKSNVYSDYVDYDFVKGSFRDEHPEIFMDANAPEELKIAFYKNRITPAILYGHREYINYLLDKNVFNTVRVKMYLSVLGAQEMNTGNYLVGDEDFVSEYVKRYGTAKFLELCYKYGPFLEDLAVNGFHDEIEDEQKIEENIVDAISQKIRGNKAIEHSGLKGSQIMVERHPELFVDFSSIPESKEVIEGLEEKFYNRKMDYNDIRRYPQLVELLDGKDLKIAFGNKFKLHSYNYNYNYNYGNGNNTEEDLLKLVSERDFLKLCAKYGNTLEGSAVYLAGIYALGEDKPPFDEICGHLEEHIEEEVLKGNMDYFEDTAPDFLREAHPELFLSEDAPGELKMRFYRMNSNYPLNFKDLSEHKEWMPFLQGKAVKVALLRNPYLKGQMSEFFDIFGEEKALKLGMARHETVREMMRANKVALMKGWYDKTGGKFIPDFVIMQNFPLTQADKFLASGVNWSNLMKIKDFAKKPEGRDAMLKLAYTFGAFDQDQRGYKKAIDLLTGIPKTISAEQGYVIEKIDKQINTHTDRNVKFDNLEREYDEGKGREYGSKRAYIEARSGETFKNMLDFLNGHSSFDDIDKEKMLHLLEAIKKERVNIDFSKDIFSQLYRKNEDGSYSLVINPQNCPKTTEAIREILSLYREIPMITPDFAHQLFGGFDFKYDPEFREFMLKNMDRIMSDPEAVTYLASIQKQFLDIKSANSNRVLTWDLAVSFVQTNKYTGVQVGNERVSVISSIAGYTQSDFDTLQRIYNYGKQRTYSSIPRIKNVSGIYHYEILRLDDPLAMAIGTLTDCCQEINNCAEVCMEHSMVDKHGRVFVIRDELGNIVAQSWVWRNKDVLCFDNIEIPDKAFTRAQKERPEVGRKGFTDEVFEIYKMAAHELIEEDEKVYKKLLEEGRITQEQYDGLRLGKVTVGLGYNDIAESLKQNAKVDKELVARPLDFEPPVPLRRSLYTSDSRTQYILEQREDRKEIEGDTPRVHSDEIIVYDDKTFDTSMLLTLEKLEYTVKGGGRYMKTTLGKDADTDHIVSEIGDNYGLDGELTRIVMNPNFAIIYEEGEDTIRIADILFNTVVYDNDKTINIESAVLLQMRLAIDQIKGGKEIRTIGLSEEQEEMLRRALALDSEINEERGVISAR